VLCDWQASNGDPCQDNPTHTCHQPFYLEKHRKGPRKAAQHCPGGPKHKRCRRESGLTLAVSLCLKGNDAYQASCVFITKTFVTQSKSSKVSRTNPHTYISAGNADEPARGLGRSSKGTLTGMEAQPGRRGQSLLAVKTSVNS